MMIMIIIMIMIINDNDNNDNNDNNNDNDNHDNDNDNNDNNNDNDNNDNDNDETEETLFDDDQTKGMFGGAVSVVVDTGVGNEIDTIYRDSYNSNHDDNDDDNDDNRSVGSYKSMNGKSKDEKSRESSLQRALREVAKKNLLMKKKKFTSPNPFPKGKTHKNIDILCSTINCY